MGNSCLIPFIPGSTTINTTKIGNAFLIHPDATNLKKWGQRRQSRKNQKDLKITILLPESSFEPSNLLSIRDKELIERCWREHIMVDRKDIFHRTMLFCIEASPKMNEIIACGRYCYRDLTKWPKLNRICQAQFNFYERLIYEFKLDEAKMHNACRWLGEMHANYAQYGLKPHFLDIYQQQFLAILAKMEMNDKAEICIAFTHLTSFVIDIMNRAYSQKSSDIRFGLWREPNDPKTN